MKCVLATVLAIGSLLAPCASQQADLEAELLTLEVLRQNPLRPELVNGQLYLIAQINSNDAAKALDKLVAKLPEAHRYIAIRALGLNESEEATKALQRMAKDRGDLRMRRQAIRVLASGDQEDLDFLHNKRLKYESDLRVRALILELLMNRGQPNLDKAFLTAAKSKDTVYAGVGLEGIGKQKIKAGLKIIHGALGHQDVPYRLAAYEALASYGGERQYAAIIKGLQDSINVVVRPEISAQLQRAQTADEVSAVISHCMRSKDLGLVTLCVKALVVISAKQPQLCSDALLELMNSSEDKIRSLSIEGLVKIRHTGLQHFLVDLLDHSSAQTRSDAAWGLSQLGDIPPETEIKLVKMASSERPSIRIQALRALRWFPNSDLAYLVINDCLEDELWAVRATAVASLELFRRDESLKPLFWLMENEAGRVRSDAIKALELLTGENFGASMHTWKSWYADQGDTYTLPTKEQATAMINARKNRSKHNGTIAQSGYHGIAVPSGGVVFILDISGSMNSRFSPTETYYQHFSKALAETVLALKPDTPFNIILFSSGVRVWKSELVESSEKNCLEAQTWLEKTTPGGATNIYGALTTALSFDEAQTIFIMTDGSPSAGEFQMPESILAEIDRINRDRFIQINTIAAGSIRAEFLADLAATNGGKAVDMRKNKGKVE